MGYFTGKIDVGTSVPRAASRCAACPARNCFGLRWLRSDRPVKRHGLPLSCIPFVGALVVVGVVGCGGTTSKSHASGGDEATYAGVVLAMATDSESASGYVARAVFALGPRPTIGGCSKCCCAPIERGLPRPEKPPDAGEITLTTVAGAAALAKLVPDSFEGGHGSFHGTTDLGWAWFPPLSDYPPTDSQPWPAGSVLAVLATGNEVGAFSGMLRAGASLEGVAPPFKDAKVVTPRAEPFTVSWTPEASSDATVMLRFPNDRGVCYCDAPDSAGRLVVDGDLLTPIVGGISLTRFTISTLSSTNASVDLVGAIVQKADFEVE
jgi:hypothetical protein